MYNIEGTPDSMRLIQLHVNERHAWSNAPDILKNWGFFVLQTETRSKKFVCYMSLIMVHEYHNNVITPAGFSLCCLLHIYMY